MIACGVCGFDDVSLYECVDVYGVGVLLQVEYFLWCAGMR